MALNLSIAAAKDLADFLAGLDELTARTGWRVAEYGPTDIGREDSGTMKLVQNVTGVQGCKVTTYAAEVWDE